MATKKFPTFSRFQYLEPLYHMQFSNSARIIFFIFILEVLWSFARDTVNIFWASSAELIFSTEMLEHYEDEDKFTEYLIFRYRLG